MNLVSIHFNLFITNTWRVIHRHYKKYMSKNPIFYMIISLLISSEGLVGLASISGTWVPDGRCNHQSYTLVPRAITDIGNNPVLFVGKHYAPVNLVSFHISSS
jgi:hypothetical protein